MTSWPLAALLDARTIAVVGASARVSGPLRRKGRGGVDFALLGSGAHLAGGQTAGAELHIGRHRGSNRIAADGAIWRPGLELNLRHRQQAPTSQPAPPALLLAETAGLLDGMLARAADRALYFSAAISPGAHSTASHWHALVEAALDLPTLPQLCFVIQRASTVEVLLQRLPLALAASPLVLLLPTAERRNAHIGHQARLCAAGIPAFSQPGRLFAARSLQRGPLAPKTGHVLGLVAEEHEAPLLDAALAEARLRPAIPSGLSLARHSAAYLAPSRQYKLGRALKRAGTASYDVIVSCGRVPAAEGVTAPQISLDAPTTNESTLHGLRSLLDAGAGLATLAAPSPPEIEATKLAESIDETQVLDALGQLEFPCAQHAFVTSASAAARVARDTSLPLRLRAVGPIFKAHQSWGGQRDAVEGPAAARQAFRDILFACQDHDAGSPLRAVLVVPRPSRTELRLYCDFRAPLPLFHIALHGAPQGAWGRFDAHPSALEGFLRSLGGIGAKEVGAALTLLGSLARLAPALSERFALLDLELIQLTAEGPRLLHGRGSAKARRPQ